MTTPGRSGQAAAVAGRAGTVRVPAVPVAGGIPTPNPPFRPSTLLSQGLRTDTLPTNRGHVSFARAADCLLMVVGRGDQEGWNLRTCPTISKMTVTLLTSQSTPTATDADALVIGVFQGTDGPVPAPDVDDIDLMAALTALGAAGKPEEVTKIPVAGRLATPVIVAVGLGPEPGTAQDQAERHSYLERLRRAAGAAVRKLTSGRARRIAVALPAAEPDEAEAVALGALLGGYAFRRYRTSGTTPGDSELIVHTVHDAAAGRARILAEAMTLVRDLVNTAPADMVPADLAAAAEQVARASGLGVQVLDENELAKEGDGGIRAVGMGSAHPPRLVRLEYTHPEATSTVVFAGKGITFDSGGLSLKPPKAMETMKADMG